MKTNVKKVKDVKNDWLLKLSRDTVVRVYKLETVLKS